MKLRRPGLTVAAAQLLLVAGLFVTLDLNQRSLPTVWVPIPEFFPSTWSGGARIWLSLEVVPADGRYPEPTPDFGPLPRRSAFHAFHLFISHNRLTAEIAKNRLGFYVTSKRDPDGRMHLMLPRVVSVVVPADAPAPPRAENGDEFLVEVAVPNSGAPRPVRLGIRRNGVLRVFPCE